MCGRYSAKASPNEIRRAFPYLKFGYDPSPRYNVAPTQSVMMVRNDGENTIIPARWGLVPSWAKSLESQKTQPINAKLETLAESRMFAPLVRRQRCILLADGFYEWQRDGSRKIPYYFSLKSGEPFAFAGIFDLWHDELLSCALITGRPNELVAPIHDRMPMMLDPDTAQEWISADDDTRFAKLALLRPYPAAAMTAQRASSQVNRVANDSPSVLTADVDEPARLFDF